MGISGPSALGTLLVQRLDAVLGTTLSQQTNLVSGARPDAVTQPADADRPEADENELVRHPQESVDRSTAQISRQGTRKATEKTGLDTRQLADTAARDEPNISSTPSAPTRLGLTARTILALLAEFPEQAPPVTAKTPLSNPQAPAATAAPRASDPGAARPPGSAPGNAPDEAPDETAGAGGARMVDAAGAQPRTDMVAVLAKALAQAMEGSGLFYESHLADMAFGKRSASTLAAEPQARLPQSGAGAGTSTGASANQQAPDAGAAAGNASSTGAQASSSTQTAQASAATQPPPTPQAAATAQNNAAAAALPPQAHLLVRQQLECLANQAFVWQGEAWPNAPMRWEVDRRRYASQGNEQASQPTYWATRLRITLPRLGQVDARLTLAQSHIAMQLSAPDSVDVLHAHAGDLQSRLSASGLTPGQITIDADTRRVDDHDYDLPHGQA